MNTGFTFPPQAPPTGGDGFRFPNSTPSAEMTQAAPSNSFVNQGPPFPEIADQESDLAPIIDIPPPPEISDKIVRSFTPDTKKVPSTEEESTTQPISQHLIVHSVVPPSAEQLVTSKSPIDPQSKSQEEEYVTNLRQQMATDWKSPSEYALHILFTKFVRHAENKLNECLHHSSEPSEPPIVDILGEGIDPTFDKIIESLGHIAKNKPKPVIDAMMFWRKTKSEIAGVAAEEVECLLREYESDQGKPTPSKHQHSSSISQTKTHAKSVSNGSRFSHKRNSSSKSSTGSRNAIENQRIKNLELGIISSREAALQADRKSLISIYILCRVLIEIVKQAPDGGDDDLNDKLEEIVFTQLKTTDPMSISSSIIKSSNWNSFAELLGWMSEKKFLSVSDRFIADLEKIPSHVTRDLEPGVHLLILGMRYLRLKNYPLEKFEEAADFMKSIAKFFYKAENLSVSLAYAEVISQLLLPLAGSMTAEVNHPTWVEAMTALLTTAAKLQTESSKYWASIFRLNVSVLCVSPASLFSEHWIPLIEKNARKIKNKNLSSRVLFVVGISRLVWVYLYRCPETLNNTTRTLSRLFSLFLSTKKKENWITTDLELINPLSDVLVTVGYAHPNFLMENAILPLIRNSFNGFSLDGINYERMILVINTYRGLLMTNNKPEFPENDSRYYELSLNDISIKQNEALTSNHEEVCTHFYKLFLLLDSNIGSEVWSPENQHNRQPTTAFEKFSIFSNDNGNNNNRNLNIALFATLIETIPSCLTISGQIPFKSTIEIISRNAVHADLLIATSCQNALKVLASKKNPYTLITWFAKYSFDFDEKTQSSYNMSYLSSTEYRRLLILYVELLECWLDEFHSSNMEEKKRETGLDGIELMPVDNLEEMNEVETLGWKNTITVIEEVEGNGLFFLCSQDPGIRRLGIQILGIISKFDEAMVEKTLKISRGHSRSSSYFAADRGTRLVDLLNDLDFYSLLDNKKNLLSVVEKSRISKLTAKYKKGVLIKLGESEYGVDAALWQRVFPKLLSIVCVSCPITMALCRSIVCIRLVQVHGIILRIASTMEDKSRELLPEVIVNQWKLFLIVACTSLTSTNDQKLHIPISGLQHGRKKSQQIFTVQHQKIKSATSVFKMVLPLLNAENALIRDAIISGLSSMNVNIYKAYIESIEGFLSTWSLQSSNNKIRIEMFHVLTILSRFLSEPMVLEDKVLLKKISEILKYAKKFLDEESVQYSYEYQTLRGYFAELLRSYYSAVRGLSNFDELFPFQARASCFNFLKEWCGYGEHAYIAEERYNTMIRSTANSRDHTAITAGIEFQKGRLQKIALETMVVLCSDTITKTLNDVPEMPIIVSFDITGLLSWIEALFNAEDESVKNLGISSLENLLEKNTRNRTLFREVAIQCAAHHKHPHVSVLYYITLCKTVLKMDDLILEEVELVSLGLYGIISDREDTRSYAVDLLSAVETKLHNSFYTKVFKERLASSSKTVYKSTAKEISSIFAELLSQELCLKIFSTLVGMMDSFTFQIKKDLLILMAPWVNKFTLKSIEELETFMVLSNLLYITIDLNNKLPMEVEQLWISLGKGNTFQNIHVSLEFIMSLSINHRNPHFVQHARDVVLYLGNVPGGIGLVDSLTSNLEPKTMIPIAKYDTAEVPENDKSYFIANIWEKLSYHGKSITFSKAHLSIIFLVNLLTNPSETLKGNVANLLHVSICLLDHYVPLIQESASKILCDLVFGFAPTHEKSEDTVELLRNKQNIWSYDSFMKDKNAVRSPKAMDLLIRNLLSIFSSISGLQIDWQKIALKWATTCSVRHITCRSFQVFRSLLTFLDQGMLRDMLHRLSNTIADANPDIQGFAMQILMTLNAITAELDPADLINFPQLFWSITACLNSIHEQEFIEVLSCFMKFISKIDLDSPDTVQCLIATFPSNWEGRFDGLQQIVMTGLRSANSADITWKFLDKLNLLKDSRIIANSDSRLLFALISNLPRFLNAMDRKDFTNIQTSVEAMVNLSESKGQPSFSRLLNSLAKNKFRSKKDFLSQVVSFISRNYFPQYSAQTLVFLSGLLLNKTGWVKVQAMEILKYIFPLVDLKRPEFTGVGADLLSPLLRLLLTEYEANALEVLDCVPAVSGSKMDKDVLRISMGNKDVKNTNKVTTTLFGIPEDSGWSVPMPTMTAATTRHNVHAVFMTCATSASGEDSTEDMPTMDDIVEFHADADYGLGRTETNDSQSMLEEKEASLSHMWAELDNLDSFFTKNNTASVSATPRDGAGPLHDRSNSADTTQTEQTFALESAPQLYDKKVSAILNHSLTKIPSNVSFKTYLADSFATSMGNDGITNELGPRSAHTIYGEESGAPPRSRNSGSFRSPANSLSLSGKARVAESPQDSLFRFEGFLRSSQRGSRRKWQQHQQHQQLLSQTIHEQIVPSYYESEPTSPKPPVRASSASPSASTRGIGRSQKSQKHYHLPHFSSKSTETD
ncbi:probable Cell morphogenesis protein PAG1 [Zygosaccharomyces bailii ISA1307]|nr:probable Cell morphogenesis protein PAG1 [Zygosaccharomyces bailii ISA1307]